MEGFSLVLLMGKRNGCLRVKMKMFDFKLIQFLPF